MSAEATLKNVLRPNHLHEAALGALVGLAVGYVVHLICKHPVLQQTHATLQQNIKTL